MPSAIPLILLHGALGSSEQLVPLAAHLGADHLLNFEGHGNRRATRPFRMQHFADNLLKLLDEQGIERANVFGYSMGGYAALHLASTHPDRLARVATLGTKFEWTPELAAREGARLNPDAIRAKVPHFAETLRARHENAGGWERVLAATADLLRELGERPLLTHDTLRTIAQPVCVIVGERDNTVSVEESTNAARMLANGRVVVLPDTPHPIEQVKLDALSPVLKEFFAA